MSIASTEDSIAEDNETFWVQLDNTNFSSVIITDNASVTITDDEARPSVSISPASSTVAESIGGLTLTVTQTLVAATDTVVTFSHSGNATVDSDYTIPSSLTIPAGSLSGNVTLTILDDNNSEPSEPFSIDIGVSGGNGASENGTQQSVITITDNDPVPEVTLSVSPTSVSESGGSVTLTATQSLIAATNTVVSFSTSGNATINSDYTIPGSITISEGHLSGNATLEILDDNVSEGNETILIDNISVSGGNGATDNTTTQPSIMIQDDDTVGLVISESSLVVSENGTTTDTFTVRLNSEPTDNVSVTLTSSDLGEMSVSDNLSFASSDWWIAQTVTVTGVDDNVSDDNQTSVLSVLSSSSDSKYNGLSDNLSVLTADNDTVDVLISESSLSVGEDGTSDTFTVRLNSEPTLTVLVSMDLNGSDEFSVSDNLSFGPDNWSVAQTVTVTGVDDNVSDDNQTSELSVLSSSRTASTTDYRTTECFDSRQ